MCMVERSQEHNIFEIFKIKKRFQETINETPKINIKRII